MTSQIERDFDIFTALISRWGGAYKCAVCSYVALKTPDGPRILFARVSLEPTRVGVSDSQFKFETEHVIAGRVVSGAATSDIAAIVERAKGGEIVGVDGPISLAADQHVRLTTHVTPIYHPFLPEGPRLPSLFVRGAQKHNLLMEVGSPQQLDWELKAASEPFDTLDELLGYCGLPVLMQIGDMTTLEIVAKVPVAITDNSKIVGGKAVVECRLATGLDLHKVRIGYRIYRKEQQFDRASVDGAGLEWRDENDLKVGSYSIAVGDAPVVQAFMSYNGIALHQWWLSDQQKHLNPRHAIHEVFDQGLEVLKRMLLKPETDAFESAVSSLLNLRGFSVINYGRIPKLTKGPDIIAVAPSGNIAVVECTVGLLDEKDKLAKLVQRTGLVRDKLNAAGYGRLQVQPVIVTALSRSEVAADLATAGGHGIAVVCKEDLEELLNQATFPPNADLAFENAKRLIPGSG